MNVVRGRFVPARPLADVIDDANCLYRGDHEKVATSESDTMRWRGVSVSSRYGKVHEIEAMIRMVEALGNHLGSVESIFCDSKAGCCYSVQLRGCDNDRAEEIGHLLDRATGGHNGIFLDGPGVSVSINPNWWD